MCNNEAPYLASDTASFHLFSEYLEAFYNDARRRWQHQGGVFLTGVNNYNEIKNQLRWGNYKFLIWDHLHFNSGFVLVPSSNIPELWIDRNVGSDDYRRVYIKFLCEIIKITNSKSALYGYELDHVYSFSSAHRKSLVRYMLLLPVLKSVNRSYSSLEQARSGDKRGQKLTHGGDYFNFAKAMGISAPSIAKPAKKNELENFIDKLIDQKCLHEGARETELNALRVLYERVRNSATESREAAKNLPLPPRGRRDITSGKLTC